MSSRIPDTHAEAWALLPWLANGRIAPEDREWVEAHVQGCAECRAELAAQRMVASQVNRDEAASPPPAASDEQRLSTSCGRASKLAESASPAATGTSGARCRCRARRAPCAGWRPPWWSRPSAWACSAWR